VLDISLPGLTGAEILAAATLEGLCTRVILLTAVEDRPYAGCQGAHSVISKEAAPEIFVYCLRQVAAGRRVFPIALLDGIPGASKDSRMRTVLTERECKVMDLASEGLSNKDIARRLSLCEGTIKIHLHHIYQKLGIKNRTILAAVRHQSF
jgi:DNA-binding NarL/FixJ family response regulator